jgi:hypothetical protein
MVYEEECQAAQIDPRAVQSIASRIERAALDAARLGIQIFGGSGSGTLRFDGRDGQGALILADMQGNWSGGDGACGPAADGLMRGETI